MKGYKAFNKGMTCRGKQYRENKTYEEKGDINLCEKGMHFCKEPLDVFNYYPDIFNNEYAEVEAIGKIKSEGDKTVTDKLTIKGKTSISNIFKIHFDILFDKVKKIKNTTNTSGYKAHANTSGNEAHANTSGDYAHANTSGNRAHANTSGGEAISCAIGISSKAKASKGWVIITNWVYDKKYVIKNIYSKKVGQKIKGVTIKADTWYWFENGELKSQKC